jgi:hypothetical protein
MPKFRVSVGVVQYCNGSINLLYSDDLRLQL